MNALDKVTCEQVFRKLDDYLDRELSPEDMGRIREHLETCAACASEHRFQAGVIEGVRARLWRVSAPEGLLSRVSGALRRDGNAAPPDRS